MVENRGVRDVEDWKNTGLGMTPGMSRTSSTGQVAEPHAASACGEAVEEPNGRQGGWAAAATICVYAFGADVCEAAVMLKPVVRRNGNRVRAR
jgi:hypothetical protein